MSFLIKITIEVNRAVEPDLILPALGLFIDSVPEVNVETDPSKTSVMNFVSFFKLFHFFL